LENYGYFDFATGYSASTEPHAPIPGTADDPVDCCTSCWETPGCLASATALPGLGGNNCINFLLDGSVLPVITATCPAGVVGWVLYSPGYGGFNYELGPCGFLAAS
jgi:hypothetical protein